MATHDGVRVVVKYVKLVIKLIIVAAGIAGRVLNHGLASQDKGEKGWCASSPSYRTYRTATSDFFSSFSNSRSSAKAGPDGSL